MTFPPGASVMISITGLKEFRQSPPAGWRQHQTSNKMICEDSSITPMTQKNIYFDGRDNFFTINTLKDLEEARHLVFSRPILTTAHCRKSFHRTGGQGTASDDGTWDESDDYVVLINTSHPQIVNQFQQAFTQAEQYVSNGDNFRVTINLNESLKVWYTTCGSTKKLVRDSVYAVNSDILLVHGVKEPNYCDKCFSCEAFIQKIFWCVCFPIFLLCGLPYLIYKKFVVSLKESTIKTPVPVTYHKGPFQMGYTLVNLLYPPGTQITTITSNIAPPPPGVVYNQPVPYPNVQPGEHNYQSGAPQGGYYPIPP